ncbi:MAG: glycoside hydrolase [Planctomycetota bacterium]
MHRTHAFVLPLVVTSLAPFAPSQLPAELFGGMRWRCIGPYRGGRTVAAVGVPGQPDTFYIGVNHGGVWRSRDAGRTWQPIFDDQPTGSIGAIAVAPSAPQVMYVGTGEGLQRPDLSIGDGVYKSSDGGDTWRNVGLGDAQQIPQVAVDPHDPNRVFVAALGHPYGANEERGVFRSLDGGDTWQKVLYRDADTGAFDVLFAARDARTVFAVLWSGRQAPWEIGGSWELPGAGLYKSTDGGDAWRQVTNGLPGAADGLGRIGLCVAPSEPGRMYAIVDARTLGGLYRSDDDGETWRRVNADPRLWGRGSDFAEVKADPKNADIVYVANVSSWKSTDGGLSFTGFRGAPGGDDPHRFWINPDDPNIILLAGDQGAIVTVNGGATWSSWYNQPTAQFYHVATDNAFPYRVYGGQQESGSVGIQSRSDDGRITLRHWHPVGVEEYGYVAPDPRDPDVIYGGKVTRYDRRTQQAQDVSPRPLRGDGYRIVRTQPLVFSPTDPQCLYFASNTLWKTRDEGRTWAQISPDLARTRYDVPANLGRFASCDPEAGQHRGVIYTIAPSPTRPGTIWVGTDCGSIHVTHDEGESWRDVTPPVLRPWDKVSMLEASPFDVEVAYAAINSFRLDDVNPHLFRTRDGGRTWQEIVRGLEPGAVTNVVRADGVRRGLLFAGSDRCAYVSFDDGDHWQSLRLNMPSTSIRDLVLKDDDVVVATHGRSFWILDDISRLRQLDAGTADAPAVLFAPRVATRIRWNQYPDTPPPPEEPAGENPPDGATLDYWLAADTEVTLEVRDEAGELVRRFDSREPPEPVAPHNFPDGWIQPWPKLSGTRGAHRFVWDLHFTAPEGARFTYPIQAVWENTPRVPPGPFVLPGSYRVRLLIGEDVHEQRLHVRMDPRVLTPAPDLVTQFELSRQVCADLARAARLRTYLGQARRQTALRRADAGLSAETRTALADLETGAAALDARAGGLSADLTRLLDVLQEADRAPTTAVRTAVAERHAAASQAAENWQRLESGALAEVNRRLREAGAEPIRTEK